METKNLNYTAEEINNLLEKIENLPTIPSFHEFSYDVYGSNESQSSGQIQSIIEADSGSWDNFILNCSKDILKVRNSNSYAMHSSLNVQCWDVNELYVSFEFTLGSTLYEITVQNDNGLYEVSRTETKLA